MGDNNPEIKIVLTADQIAHFDRINAESQSVDQALKVALNYHVNKTAGVTDAYRKWWQSVCEPHGIDLDSVRLKVKNIDLEACVVLDDSPESEGKGLLAKIVW